MNKLILLLLLSSAAWSQSFFRLPQPFPNTTMNVCPVPSGGNPCPSPVNIYQDQGLTQLITQPVNIGATGNIGFWVSPSTSQFTVQIGPPYNTEFIVGGGGGALAYSAITAGSNTVAKTEGTGGSLAPLNIGQVVGSQVWIPSGFIPSTGATLSASSTGGSLVGAATINVAYCLNSLLGCTMIGRVATVGIGAGSTNSVTVTAPTIPAGYTGYTVYDCSGATTCTPLLQQAASSACVNITTNCLIQVLGAGGTAPQTNTAYLQPAGVQAQECPPSVIPYEFIQTNDGNFHTYAGVSTNTANGNTGVKTICQQTFFTDLAHANSGFAATSSEPISYNNAMIAFNHSHAELNQGVQNRMLAGASFTPVGFAGTLWGAELMQFEMDKNCNGCTFNGSPDGEFTLGSFQMQDNSVTNAGTSLGTNILRLHYFKAGNGYDTGAGDNVINSIFQFNNTTAMSAAVIYKGTCAGSGTISAGCMGNWFTYNPSLTLSALGQTALYAQSSPGGGNNGINFFIRSDTLGIPSDLNGNVSISGYSSNVTSLFTANASEQLNGSLTVAQPSAPAANGVSCTGGASQYTYVLVGIDSNGGASPGTPTVTPTTCVNPLTVGNPALLSITETLGHQYSLSNPAYLPFKQIDVYRTAGPMATGKIGTLTCSGGTPSNIACSSFSDTGLSASGTVPSVNTTGSLGAAGIITGGNTVYVTTDFTSAANTNLQTITGLVWNVSQAAQKHAFHCSLNYSQATAAASMQFGIQVATVAPNSVDARGRIDTSATAIASGTLNGLNTTTATAIVTFTPSTFATVFGAELDGTLDLPQNNQGNVINIMVQTSNSADLPTVKKGSYCSILP